MFVYKNEIGLSDFIGKANFYTYASYCYKGVSRALSLVSRLELRFRSLLKSFSLLVASFIFVLALLCELIKKWIPD